MPGQAASSLRKVIEYYTDNELLFCMGAKWSTSTDQHLRQ